MHMDDKGRLVLPGATKETLRAMPQFEYHRK
jgi:DNA-binding transcriptional regulator/RsmH inhibitor MraZ